MRATAVPVDGNKVRLSVEVDESEIDEAVDATAKRLTRQLRVPGFRPGRVPRPVLEARLGGAAALRQQAISDALPDLYARAISDSDLDPIAAPEIDVVSGEDSGPLTFDAVVEVRPTVSVPGYQGLVVTVPSVEVSEEEVDEQVDRLRRQSGELNAVTRPARKGDHVTIDLHAVSSGRDDLDVEDYLYEVGSGSDIPGLDEQLTGAKQGDIFKFSAPLPGPTSADTSDAEIRVLVKEVKEMILPEPTDEWASEMSEFETIEELREERRTALERVKVARAQMTLREGALEALVALVADEPPESLVEEEVRERVHDLGHRLEARRVTLDQFLEVSGRSREELTAELRAEAVRDVRADLALRALADAEDLEVTDEELDQAVREIADEASSSYEEIRARLDRSGRLSAVRSGRRKAKALSWLLEHVELMDDDGKPVSRDDLRGSSAAEETTASIEVGTETGPASTDTITTGELGSEDVGVEEEAAQEAGT